MHLGCAGTDTATDGKSLLQVGGVINLHEKIKSLPCAVIITWNKTSQAHFNYPFSSCMCQNF